MKTLKSVAIILLVVGFILLVLAYLSRIQHWPDALRGFYSGPALMLIGVILLITRLIRR
jgi:uncharacterized membrane protein YidH (DUF202 family)